MGAALGNDLSIIITEIDANLSHADSLTHGLSQEQFNWSPAPGQWSIGQNFAHLNRVNRLDVAPLRTAIESGRSRNLTGEGPFTYGLMSRKFIAGMEPPPTRKFKAPKTYQPAAQAPLESTLADFRALSAEIRALALSAAGLHLGKIKTPMPAVNALVRAFLRMPLGARLELIVTHDRRHLWQAEQVREHPDFPR